LLIAHLTTSCRNQELIDTASIAIWNKHRVAVMLAITVWGIDVVFHIQSKPLHLTSPEEDPDLMEFHIHAVW
jgi:hypothetical protein